MFKYIYFFCGYGFLKLVEYAKWWEPNTSEEKKGNCLVHYEVDILIDYIFCKKHILLA